MPVSEKLIVKVGYSDEEDAPAKKPRTKAGDKPFSPPDLAVQLWGTQTLAQLHPIELRPSRFGLADALNAHYQRLRRDAAYAEKYTRFRIDEKRKDLAKAESFLQWRVKQTGPAPIRVRASELKECKRQVTMRLLGFTPGLVGEDSPHWNVAALIGENLHQEVEIALKFLGLSAKSEYRVQSPKKDLNGIIDHRLAAEAFEDDLEERAVPAILDVKSVGPDDFKKGTYSGKVKGFVMQISAYGLIEEVNLGVVLMADRGSGRFMDFEFDIDPLFAQKMFDRATDIVASVQERKLPVAEKFAGSKPGGDCWNFCPFRRQCFRQEEDGSIQRRLDEGADPKEL